MNRTIYTNVYTLDRSDRLPKITLIIDGHPIPVPKVNDLPVRTALKIATETDSNKQLSLLLDALCDALEYDAVALIDRMTVEEAIELVSDWMKKSNADREEPEIV